MYVSFPIMANRVNIFCWCVKRYLAFYQHHNTRFIISVSFSYLDLVFVEIIFWDNPHLPALYNLNVIISGGIGICVSNETHEKIK